MPGDGGAGAAEACGQAQMPRATNTSSGTSLMAVATDTSPAAPRTPRRLTQVMPPIAARITAVRPGPAAAAGTTLPRVDAKAPAMPPQASTLDIQVSMPQTKPASGPKASAT